MAGAPPDARTSTPPTVARTWVSPRRPGQLSVGALRIGSPQRSAGGGPPPAAVATPPQQSSAFGRKRTGYSSAAGPPHSPDDPAAAAPAPDLRGASKGSRGKEDRPRSPTGVLAGRSVTFGSDDLKRGSSAGSGGSGLLAQTVASVGTPETLALAARPLRSGTGMGGQRRRRADMRRPSSGFDDRRRPTKGQRDEDGLDPLKPALGLYGEGGKTQRRRSVFLFAGLPRAKGQEVELDMGADSPDCCPQPSNVSNTSMPGRQGSRIRRVASAVGVLAVLPEDAPPETDGEKAFAAAMEDAAHIPFAGEGAGCTFGSASTLTTLCRPSAVGSLRSQPGGIRTGSASVIEDDPSSPEASWRRKRTVPAAPAPAGLNERSGSVALVDEEGDSDSSDSAAPRRPPKPKLGRPGFAAPPQADDDPEDEIQAALASQRPECNLGDMALAAVPSLLFTDCSHCVSLDLYGNVLAELPEELCGLACLERLSVKSNKLRTLPAALGRLSRLTHLYLDQNELERLPDSCGQLQALQVVGLDWNEMAGFPECLCNIAGLRTLFLCENPGVVSLPPPEQMRRFERLELHVDNVPAVVAEAAGMGDGVRVEMVWNKIFPDRVLDHVYLGSLRSAQELRVYRTLGIGYLASIGRELSVVLGEGMEQLQLNVDDLSDTDLSPLFEKVHDFIEEAKAQGKACLVHCFKGQSRSATMVMTYLMRTRRMTRDDALAFVRQHRPMVNPNPGFMDLMSQYEVTLGLRCATGDQPLPSPRKPA
eukprot:TRINITY_DN4476_c0_g3_i2.p1 TRINITY_DN4476_c0_g3~~TRINITY_DN4476_c0_g3_i2.p1  ORF type:complete len:761 (+),score=288.46 TRINITY_DN4476_c0_g3_i2:79-2361(+)